MPVDETAEIARLRMRDCIGFEIPDRFVVGYGLDYAERYRNLPYVGILTPEAIAAET